MEEEAGHMFFHCRKVIPIWWETLSWVKNSTALSYDPRNHFLHHGSILNEGTRANRWKCWWLAVTWTIWQQRNKMIFSNESFDNNKVMEDATFLLWTWLRYLEKDFSMHFNQWTSNLRAKYGQDACNVGDEGGFAPSVQDNREGFVLLVDAIEKAGYTGKIKIGMDVAASEFYTKDGKYDLNFMKQPNDGAHVHSTQSLGQLYKNYVKEFPIVSIKDPFDQDDWGSWASLLASVDIQLVDDLLVTNPKRIAEAIKKKACNGLLLKVNQIGTVTESIQAALDSKAAGWGVVVSHRSGETEDNFIADLSVGLASGQTKTGAPCRSERLAKYNQLLRIEEELGSVQYAGETFRSP
ncbi:Enolase 1, chloroplastic [Glycine soja]|nr:Enolase 1, chloroplastic [Glycine soja]